MRKYIVGAVAALATLLCMAATTTGFPSRPTFQTLKTTAGGDSIRVRENASNGFVSFYNSTEATRHGYLEANASASQINLASENGFTLRFMANNIVGQTFNATTAVPNFPVGLTSAGVNVCLQNGTNCPAVSLPKIVWGRIQSAGGITDSGGYGGATLSSVTKGTTGKYQLNMSGFSSGPACTCSAYQSSTGYFCQNDAATGSILMSVTSGGTFVPIDMSFQFHCIGG